MPHILILAWRAILHSLAWFFVPLIRKDYPTVQDSPEKSIRHQTDYFLFSIVDALIADCATSLTSFCVGITRCAYALRCGSLVTPGVCPVVGLSGHGRLSALVSLMGLSAMSAISSL